LHNLWTESMVAAALEAKKFVTSQQMLNWQYFQILAELGHLQAHASDPTCPCRLSKELGENCLAKHSLMLSSLAAETAAMDSAHFEMLMDLSADAKEKHEGMKAFLCDKKDEPEFMEWSRQWRKKIEPFYYHGSCKLRLKQEHVCLYQEPKVKISGTCTKDTCSLKVKGSVETVETTTAAGLPDAIDSVIRHLEKRAEGKATPLTYAIGSTSLTRYELRYRVRDAKTLISSNDPITFEPNKEYPQDLQPRLRGRAANKAQVLQMAANLDPDALLDDFHSVDRGAPIVDDNGVVLSGNGRVMAIQHAIAEFPKSYAVYKEHLTQAAPNYGLKVGKIDNPVLVRELVTKIDKRTFVEEANASPAIASSAIEVARSDAQKITPTMLNALEVGDGQTVEDALRSSANGPFVSSFLAKLSANERAAISDAKGMLNQDGIRRITMAIFVSVFPGDIGIRLSEKFFEVTDVNVRNVFNGIVGALGQLAQSEAMTRSEQRAPELSIGEDLAQTVAAYSDIKKTPGMTVDKYLSQSQMFERRLNAFQEKLLSIIDARARSGKKITKLLKAYADIVMSSPPPAQGALIPGAALTKEEALDTAVKRSEESETAAMLQSPRWCPSLGTAAKEIDKAIKAVGTSQNKLKVLAGKLEPSLKVCSGQSIMFQEGHQSSCSLLGKPVKTKEPWLMTINEFHDSRMGTPFEMDWMESHFTHKEIVKDALGRGLSVPPEVLKEYPDLQATAHCEEATMYEDDPLLKTIHAELCPGIIPCLAKESKSKLPVCTPTQRESRESCIQDMKARNREAGCAKEEGTGSKKCPRVFAVCTKSIGCRLGRAKERL